MHEPTTTTDDARAQLRELHARAHAACRAAHRRGGQEHRYAILAWTFVRGLAYRRAEAHHLAQETARGIVVHGEPSSIRLHKWLEVFGVETTAAEVRGWLREPAVRVLSRGPRLVVLLRGDVPKTIDQAIVEAVERGEAPALPADTTCVVLGGPAPTATATAAE